MPDNNNNNNNNNNNKPLHRVTETEQFLHGLFYLWRSCKTFLLICDNVQTFSGLCYGTNFSFLSSVFHRKQRSEQCCPTWSLPTNQGIYHPCSPLGLVQTYLYEIGVFWMCRRWKCDHFFLGGGGEPQFTALMDHGNVFNTFKVFEKNNI